MREILFRGFHECPDGDTVITINGEENRGEWVYGFLYITHNSEYEIGCYHKETNIERFTYLVIPETVGQYTGLTDKNGKKIFEGDIIKRDGNDDCLAIVRFGEFGCISIEHEAAVDEVIGWYYEVIPTDWISQCLPFCLPFQINSQLIDEAEIDVIGNVHDKPELLRRIAEND